MVFLMYGILDQIFVPFVMKAPFPKVAMLTLKPFYKNYYLYSQPITAPVGWFTILTSVKTC